MRQSKTCHQSDEHRSKVTHELRWMEPKLSSVDSAAISTREFGVTIEGWANVVRAGHDDYEALILAFRLGSRDHNEGSSSRCWFQRFFRNRDT